MTAQERLLSTAVAEIGYLEKKSNAQLDDKTANAGSANYTKYARDLDELKDFFNYPKQGFAWCSVFVSWCFYRAFGKELAQSLTCQPKKSCGAGVNYSAQYYKAKGQFYTANPQPGDQIFFVKRNLMGGVASWQHTGLVEKVESGYVHTIEGNTSGASGVVANGGGVCRKKYALTDKSIGGYGRPNWGIVPNTSPTLSSLKVGDMVDFIGTTHYPTASATSPYSCKPGKARVTAIFKSGKHPYHLVRETGGGSTVYGWVNAEDIKI